MTNLPWLHPTRVEALLSALEQRILIVDGAMGTMIQRHELQEADYTPLQGPTWRAKFSIDALGVDLTPTAGGDTVHGTRDTKRADSAWFGLELFAGGRFVVQASSRELRAEYTIYGSGSPIISSTRGSLQSP